MRGNSPKRRAPLPTIDLYSISVDVFAMKKTFLGKCVPLCIDFENFLGHFEPILTHGYKIKFNWILELRSLKVNEMDFVLSRNLSFSLAVHKKTHEK